MYEDLKKWVRKIKLFIPASKNARENPELIFQVAARFPYALNELVELNGLMPELIPDHTFNQEKTIAGQLKERFRFYGSDKSKNHRFHLIYGEILARLGVEKVLNILEIGIGSNDPNAISTMGINGKPGASLRAFRDVATNSHIFGADIDRNILFKEDRISTTWVDQMQPNSFWEMHQEFGNPSYDLIIDDGLHSISPNINTLLFALQNIKAGGWIVIEDIWGDKICWNTVYQLIPAAKYNKFILSCPEGCWLFVVQRKQL